MGHPQSSLRHIQPVHRSNFGVLSQNSAQQVARVHRHRHRQLSDHLAEKIQSRLIQQKLGQFRSSSITELKTSTQINHFGALRGDNSFAELPCVLIASRQAQHYRRAEDMAAVLSSNTVQRLDRKKADFNWYPKETTYIVHRSGETGWAVSNDYHADTLVEAVRASITNDNLEQALGRTRNIRRSVKPLKEYILTNVSTYRKVDGVFTMAELKAATSWLGVLLHAGIWVISGKGTAVLFHILVGLQSQRRDSLYRLLVGDPAFENKSRAKEAAVRLGPYHQPPKRLPTETPQSQGPAPRTMGL